MRLFIVLFALVAAVITVIALRKSDQLRVTRDIVIAAPPEAIFPHINNLRAWHAWSPWAKMDPNAKETFEGPAEGVGAVMRWSGNMQVGAGSMTIIDSRPDLIRIQLEFLKPMKGTNTAEFRLTPEAGGTRVTWYMEGEMSFPAKVMSILMNCEKMVGKQFDQGLASIKTLVEKK